MEFGEKLRSLRMKAGLTQLDIAEKLDVSAAAIGAWENGRAKPRLTKLGQLAELLGTSAADLMGEDADPVPFRASGAMVPLLGHSHMGEAVDEETCERMVEVPSSVVEAHPGGYCIHATGSCMDNRYAHDAILYVDPNMMPRNGDAVLAEVEGYQSVVRSYLRGSSTTMLTADSHSGEFPDIVAGPEDPPVVLKGVIVWYQAERDIRR